MKKIIYAILGLVAAVVLVSTVMYLIKSNSAESEEFLTRKPTVQDMEDKVMATGKIVPKEEIEIKPNISGIIDQILVKEGDKVAAGQLIATLRIVPSVADVNNALQQVSNAQLQINNAKTRRYLQTRVSNLPAAALQRRTKCEKCPTAIFHCTKKLADCQNWRYS